MHKLIVYVSENFQIAHRQLLVAHMRHRLQRQQQVKDSKIKKDIQPCEKLFSFIHLLSYLAHLVPFSIHHMLLGKQREDVQQQPK